MKKAVSLLLIVILAFSCFAMTAGAQTGAATKTNKIGNLIFHGLLVCESGGWTYYRSDKGHLVRINAKNQVETIAKEEPHYISVEGDWIYYASMNENFSLIKIKTDGTGRQKISDKYHNNTIIQGGWIYYIMFDGVRHNIYKMKSDGTQIKKIASNALGFVIDGDKIYYVNYDHSKKDEDYSKGYELYSINTDGTGRKKVNIGRVRESIIAVDNWLYCISPQSTGRAHDLFRVRPDGTDKTLITDDALVTGNFSVDGNWVYYKRYAEGGGSNMSLHKIKTDGTGKKRIQTDGEVSYICLTKDWLYYYVADASKLDHGPYQGGGMPEGLVNLRRISRSKIDK